jgi:TonB-linked SusC/RagA family outer membrane protein
MHTGAIASLLLLFMLCGTAYAQEDSFTVSGTVVDSTSGQSLPGVNVQVVGTTIGTATDIDGQYALEAPSADATLQFSFVGYETETIDIQGRSTIDVFMQPSTLTGEEVVVVGYSEQRRADLTGSVQVVDTEDLAQLPSGQITEKLQGNAAGVSVISSGQPGQDPQIRIRGINTFGNNTPLFVVDGVSTQSINDLNPDNIASIQVLKDASAASIYGARASNGVVIIETKQGEGDLNVQLSTSVGLSQQPDETPWNIASPQQHAQLEQLAQCNSNRNNPDFAGPSHPQYAFPNGCDGPAELPSYILPAGSDDVDESTYFVIPEYTDPAQLGNFTQIVQANQEGTRWFDEIMRTGVVTNTDLTVSGGNEQGSYLLSAGYRNEEGTMRRTYLERYSLRVNTTYNVSDNIRVGENLSYTAETNFLSDELVEGSAIGMAMRALPIIPVRDIQGNFGGTAGGGLGNASNPVAQRERTRNNENLSKRLFGNVFAEVTFLEDFRARTLIGGSIQSGFFETFQFPTYELSENNTRNALSETTINNIDWTWTNTVNYSNTFSGNHNVSALAGVEWKKQVDRFETAGVQSFFSFDEAFVNLSNGTGTRSVSSGKTIVTLASQFGKVDYNYSNRYFVSASIRRDGSSRFLRSRYGIFPSGSVGWRLTDEPFMEGVFPWLTDLKFRASYGILGNQLNVAPNNAFTLFGSEQFAYNISGDNASTAQGFSATRIGNPSAKWEEQTNVNVGVDLAVIDGRVEATIDYYRKDIEGLLFNPELPAPAGQAAVPFVNIASMNNSGIDASLRTEVSVGDLQIRGSINVTSYNNEITKVSDAADAFSAEDRRFNASNIVRNEVGQEVSSFYGFQVIGFWQDEEEVDQANFQAQEATGNTDAIYQTDAAPGRFRYADLNGDNQITPEDRTFLGSPHPNFTSGLNLSFRYSNWDLRMSFYGSQGADVWNQTKWWTHFRSGFQGAKSVAALEDSWKPGQDNANATVPIQETQRTVSTNQVPNSFFVEDADYIRLRNLQLGYTLPSNLVQRVGAQQVQLYIQGSNLLTFTNYSNPEPEIGGDTAQDAVTYGIDEGAYPTPRQYRLGVTLSF